MRRNCRLPRNDPMQKERRETMLDYKIMYASHTGNTQRLAACIYQTLQQLGRGDIEEISEEASTVEADLLFVGVHVEKGDCTLPVQKLLKKTHGKQIALFGTCGFGQSQEYFDQIEARVRQWIPEDNDYLGCFLCMGKMPMQVRKRYEAMEKNPDQKATAQMLLRNFDAALLHPNGEDFQHAVQFAVESWHKAENPAMV